MSLPDEVWEPAYGYEGLYEVSNMGRVRSIRTGKVLRPSLTLGGYEQLVLTNASGKKKNNLVHRMVLCAFVGPCPEGMECCHGDGDKKNNRVANLRWDTKRANMADRDAHGSTQRGHKHRNAKLTDAQVASILRDSRPVLAIARELGVAWTTVGRIKQGINWAHASRA